jgi:hypothetical protein
MILFEMHRAGALLVDRKTGDRTTIHVDRAACHLTCHSSAIFSEARCSLAK